MFNLPNSGSNQSSNENQVNSTRAKPFSHLRIMKDFNELESLPRTCEVTQPDSSDLSQIIVTISPDEGYYKGGRFIFSLKVPNDYPCVPPKVKCAQTIYHPNIDLSGNVCLNILREDWKPMFSLVTIVLGLVFLFLEPNPDDPLNHEAATVYKTNLETFESNVKKSMSGGIINDIQYNNVLC